MNQEDKHKSWALEPDPPRAEPAVEPGPGTRSARRGKARRWPVFGTLSWLAMPAACLVWFLMRFVIAGEPLGSYASFFGVFMLLLGVSVCFFLGALSGFIGCRRSEPWWGIALVGAMLNIIPLCLLLYGMVMMVFALIISIF
jgi:hypothetical protein